MSFTVTQSAPTTKVESIDPHFAMRTAPTEEPGVETLEETSPDKLGSSSAFGGTSGISETTLSGEVAPVESDDTGNVLKTKSMLNFPEYKAIMTGRETKHLESLQKGANESLREEYKKKRFYNLSLKEITENVIVTVTEVMNDILELAKTSKGDLGYQEIARQYALIFLKEKRLIYIGVFLVFLSLIFMVIFLSF